MPTDAQIRAAAAVTARNFGFPSLDDVGADELPPMLREAEEALLAAAAVAAAEQRDAEAEAWRRRGGGPHASMASYDEVKAAIAAWIHDGAAPENLPPEAGHFVLACHGAESAPVGTLDALYALTEECEECSGEGSFQDDSHPANPAYACETCHGFGRVPRRATPRGWAEGSGCRPAAPTEQEGE
jgi:hypothetical protein